MSNRGTAAKSILAVAVIIVVIILLLNPAVQGILRSVFIDPFQESYPESSTFTLERTLTIDAQGGTVFNHTMEVPVPKNMWMDGESLQQVITTSTQPNSTVETRYGVDWMRWESEGPSFSGTRSVTITYEMKISTYMWDISSTMSGDVGAIPQELNDRYLGDEWRIIVDDPSIRQMAASIVDTDNVLDALRSIYDWIRANIDYASTEILPHTSVQTLSSGMGDCDDQAVLFCALSRASGIPAWLQLGFLYDSHSQAWGGHGWVQTYIPLDQGGMKVTLDTVNDDFLVWRSNRFSDFTDDGNASHLEDYYYSFHCSYDPDTYPEGETPTFDQSLESITYQESEERVGPEDFQMVMLSASHIARKTPGSGS